MKTSGDFVLNAAVEKTNHDVLFVTVH